MEIESPYDDINEPAVNSIGEGGVHRLSRPRFSLHSLLSFFCVREGFSLHVHSSGLGLRGVFAVVRSVFGLHCD